jgi:transposase
VRQRIIINFGPIHRYTKEEIRKIIRELSRFYQLEETPRGEGLPAEGSQDFGGTYAIFRIWDELGWSQVLEGYLRGRHYDFDVVANLKVLVANRLLDPMAKLHILEWMDGVHFPGIKREDVDYNHLLRSMDFLIEHKEVLEPKLASALIGLFDTSLDLVFYDLTSCYFEIDHEDRDRGGARGSSLRNYGYDRDRSGCPQLVLGLVMTREGMPLCHWVFPGQTPDRATLKAVVKDLKARFPIKRCVVVGDRGLLSEDNLEVLSGAGLDYIVALALRRSSVTRRVVEAVQERLQEQLRLWKEAKVPLEQRECFLDVHLDGRRFVVAHSEAIAKESRRNRAASLREATSYVSFRVARTHGQQKGSIPKEGRVLSHQDTLLHLHDYLRDRKLGRYYRLWLDEDGTIRWGPNEENRRWENLIDGKLILETTNRTLSPQEVVLQYKELQDIERCFRTLKSSLDIRPVYHFMDRRIRAHVFICVMALQIQRLMRLRLHLANIHRSPERVLQRLSLQRSVEAEAQGRRIQGLVKPSPGQLSLFKALRVPVPQHKDLGAQPL